MDPLDLIPVESKMLGEKVQTSGKVVKWDVSFLETATRLVAAGMTEKEVGYFLGVKLKDIRSWKRKYPLFKKACLKGRELAKNYLIARMIKTAAGYDYVEKNVKIKYKKDKETGKMIEQPAEVSEFHKHQKADPALLVFALTNMSRQLKDEIPWLSQHRIQVDENKTVNIKLSGKVISEQIDRLAGALGQETIIDAEFEKDKKSKAILPGVSKRRKKKSKVEKETPHTLS